MKGFMNIPRGYLRGVSVCIAATMVFAWPALHGSSETVPTGTAPASMPARASADRPEAGQRPETAIRIVDAIDESNLVTLKGNTHPLARAAFDKGPVSPDLPMGDLVLVLSRGAEMQAAFDQFVAGQYDKKSPNYHRWLSAEEVGQEFGPAPADIDVISSWLIGHGFAIQEVTKDRDSIRFSGTASQVESTFRTEIHNLDVKGEKHIANMSDPQIPAALAPVVLGIKALHNFFPHPQHRLGGQVSLNRETGTWQRVGAPASIPTTQPGLTAPTGIRPEFGTVNGYGDVVEDVTPYDFAAIYNVLPLWTAGTPIDGTGQTIAVAGISNINLADVATFRSAFGLPAKAPTVVITNNDPGDCPEFDASCAPDVIENTLDVEWAGAVAKGANIVLVISSAPTPTSDALYLSANYIVQNKTASILSASYGECEQSLGNSGNAEYNSLWETAASEGIAVFVASGDAGSPDCDQGLDEVDGVPYAAQYGLTVNGIGSTPYNTSVGGTDLNWGSTAAPYWNTSNATSTGASALGYIPEVAWNQTCANPLMLPGLEADAAYLGISGVVDAESACNFVLNNWIAINTNDLVNLAGLVDTVGGGGGESLCSFANLTYCQSGYAKPSWQVGVPGIPADGQRDLPDLSFFASDGFLGSAYLYCVSGGGNVCSYSATSEPTAQEIGGTSVATPAMAGIMALINQKSGTPQGDPNTVLYELAAKQSYSACSAETVTAASSCVFNDIDSGTNAMPCAAGLSANCTALYSGDALAILSGYSAGTGYDEATGLGSLNVANAVNNWPGAAPFVSLSTTGLTFASTVQGYSSATQAITLKNTGSVALSLNGTGQGISITGANANSFTQTNTCGTSVAAGGACTITVTFKPAAIGALAAAVNVADNTYGSPQTVTLAGTGLAPAPAVTLSANSISFSAQWVGASSTAPNMTLTNSGTAALSLSSISFTGTNASSFSQTNTCGTSVAVGATCNIAITFAPKAAGALTANLSVTDNAPGSPQTVGVSGTGYAVVRSPTSLTFPASVPGVAAPTKQVTITNASNTALSGIGLSITGTNASSFSQTNTCGTSVASEASCIVTVTFKPAAVGVLTATVNIADNALGSPQTVTLSGTGQGLVPTVTLSATSLSFGSVKPGATSASQSVTLTNTGTGPLAITSITVTGAGASSFVFANSCGTSVASGANCTIHGHFTPATTGALTAAITITDNAANSPQSITLSGTGLTPSAVSLSASSLSYGSERLGSTSASQSVTLTNTGTAPLAIASIAVTGTDASSFVFANSCGTSVAAGANCTIHGHFTPATTGALTAAITITDNAANSPQSISLSGTGLTPAVVTLSTTSLSFGSVQPGVTSPSQSVMLTNTGTGPLAITSIAVTGTDASSFVFANSCGTSVAAGANCTIHGHFTPATTGALTAAITITDNASNSPQSISLSGNGATPPAVSLSASSLSFAGERVGVTSASQSVTLTNTGTGPLVITSIAVTGTDASSFVFSNSCGTSVAAGANCAIHGHFTPATTGALTAAITITDNASGSPQSISLSGTGLTPPAVSLSASSLTFAGERVGVASASQSVTLTNTRTGPLAITSIAVTGADASSFVFSNSCGTSVAGGANCTIHGHFTPAATGALTAAVSIANNAIGSPQTVALTGTGQ
jgi:hypothetical protein